MFYFGAGEQFLNKKTACCQAVLSIEFFFQAEPVFKLSLVKVKFIFSPAEQF